jgi:hypothetical protein
MAWRLSHSSSAGVGLQRGRARARSSASRYIIRCRLHLGQAIRNSQFACGDGDADGEATASPALVERAPDALLDADRQQRAARTLKLVSGPLSITRVPLCSF